MPQLDLALCVSERDHLIRKGVIGLPPERPFRVAFREMGGATWTAGLTYFRNLFLALKSVEKGHRVQICYLAPPNSTPDGFLRPYLDDLIPMPADEPRTLLRRVRGRLEKRFAERLRLEPKLSRTLRQERTDCLFSYQEYGPGFRVPLLSWVPDLQHLHLPEMFSQEERDYRSNQFTRIARNATRIILSSRSAEQDFKQFAPEAASKMRVLPFVAHVSEEIFSQPPGWVCQEYHLPERFIYLPNQFWRHKNHSTVVEALATARKQRPALTIVCTGNTNDYRNLTYFGELLMTISKLEVRQNLILLGLLPHAHLYQLIRQSQAVLQPSLFEGWSTTVEEVKSIGKRIVISDIPVHREQDPPQALFFAPRDAGQLAEILVETFDQAAPGPDLELERQARTRLPGRIGSFGRAFLEIVREVATA